MIQDEIIEMARQAGMAYEDDTDRYIANIDDLQDFAKLVALRYEKKISDLENIICQRHWDVLQEREACAKIIYDSWESTTAGEGIPEDWLLTLAELIQARSNA